jgi:hypothetical protein
MSINDEPGTLGPDQDNEYTCTCAAAWHAERWFDDHYEIPDTPDGRRLREYIESSFIAGYHCAIHLIRVVLHDTPVESGNPD